MAAVDKNEKYFNTRRSGKTVKDFNSFGYTVHDLGTTD